MQICKELKIEGTMQPLENVEVTRRVNEKGSYLFILNHNEGNVNITMEKTGRDLIHNVEYKKGQVVELKGRDVIIYKEDNETN